MQSSRAEHQNCAVRSEWNKFISQTDLGSSSISKKIKTMYLCIETLAASCKKKKKKKILPLSFSVSILSVYKWLLINQAVNKKSFF